MSVLAATSLIDTVGVRTRVEVKARGPQMEVALANGTHLLYQKDSGKVHLVNS